MWVTQTYLGNVECDASIFVYYLFEDYKSDQVEFTEEVQKGLEELGELFHDRVSLLMPNPRYAEKIESEAREALSDLWWSLRGRLPGLLFTTTPLSKFDGRTGDYYLVSFSGKDISAAAEAVNKVRRLAYDQMAWNHAHDKPKDGPGLIGKLINALEIKPGMAGIRIDLLKLKKR